MAETLKLLWLSITKHTSSSWFQKYFQNISWLVLEKMFSLSVAMIVGIYVARYLKPENYGMLNYAMSFVGIFAAFSSLGLESIILRELARKPEIKNEILGTAFALKLFSSIALVAVIVFTIMFTESNGLMNTIIMIIASAEIFKAYEVINTFFQSKVMSKYVVQTQIFVNLFISIVKIAMVALSAPFIWFAWIILINSTLNAAGFIYTYRKRNDSTLRNWYFKKETAINLLKESWPITLQSAALLTQARIDQVMLGKLLNNYEVGQYSVALRFIEMFGLIPMLLKNTFAPSIAKAKEINEALYQGRIVNFFRLMFILFLVVSVPLFFLAEDVIVLLYGVEYQAAGFLLSLFAIRLFFTNIGVGKSFYVVNESLFKYSLISSVIGAIANIAINFILIPLYGSIGAIIATVISFTISIFIMDWFFERTRPHQKLLLKGILTFWRLKNIS